MKGFLKKEKNGTWTYRVDLGIVDGKRRQKKKRGFRTQREANDALTNFIKTYDKDNIIDSKGMSVGEYLDSWLTNYASSVSKSTASSYKRCIKYQLSDLSDIPLNKLNPIIIQTYYTQLLEKYSPTSVNYAHRILKMSMKQAVRWKLIPYSPVDAVETPKKAHIETETLTIDEIDLLKKYLCENNRDFYIPFMVGVTTGMRRGEIAALEWSDISFENARIHVNRAMKRIDKEIEISAPKNKSSSRSIGMTQSLITTLKLWKINQMKNKVRYGEFYGENIVSGKRRDFVCTYENGKYIPLDYYSRTLRRSMKALGIDKYVRFHDLRHTHATLLLEQNVEAKIVQDRLGHSNISTTMDLYSHVTKNAQDRAVEKLDEII